MRRLPVRRTAIVVMAVSCLVTAAFSYGDVHWVSIASRFFVAVVTLLAIPWIKD
ncbi:MAG: hypothetical protein ACKVHE_26650 [Planctomycetales bacterium]|jgi:hypothetical protein